MSVAIICLWVIQLSTTADINRLLVQLAHVEHESQVIISMNVLRVYSGAVLKALHREIILL